MLCSEDSEVLAQAAQKGCGCPVPGGAEGQPEPQQGAGTGRALRSFQPKSPCDYATLRIHNSITPNDTLALAAVIHAP